MAHLKELATALANVQIAVEYWDVRLEDTCETTIDIIDGEITTSAVSPSLGAFLRVRKDGFWFYESTTEIKRIPEILKNLSLQKAPRPAQVKYHQDKQPPFTQLTATDTRYSAVGLGEKVQLVQSYETLARNNKKVIGTNVRYRDVYKVKAFVNSVGTQFEYDFNQGGLVLRATLKNGDKLFDDAFRIYGSDFNQLKGHEAALQTFLVESEKFIDAPAITPGKYTVVLDSEVAGVFTHESFGHKSEADGMLGNPIALEEWKIGKKIAADCLTIVDYGGHAQTSGYCPIDDDGIPAQKNYLIKNGVLAGRLHSVETAVHLDERPTGNSRAMNFEFEPIVRMTSTYIEAGKDPLEDVLKQNEGAILVEGVKHGSGLSTFTIAPFRGYRIGKNGAREPVRLTVLSGSVFETLNNISAVTSDFHLHSSAVGGCGKGNQWPLSVADGGPYVVVNNMQVS